MNPLLTKKTKKSLVNLYCEKLIACARTMVHFDSEFSFEGENNEILLQLIYKLDAYQEILMDLTSDDLENPEEILLAFSYDLKDYFKALEIINSMEEFEPSEELNSEIKQ